MLSTQPLDSIPIWFIYPLTVLVLMGVLEGGYWLGKILKRKFAVRTDAGVGAISAAALALLTFMLAFTVSFSIGMFIERRQVLVDEFNAIGTAYLRAGFLEEPHRTESRELLSAYSSLRIPENKEELDLAIILSEEIHKELWDIAEKVVSQNPDPVTALYVSSLNDVIDLHTKRLVVNLLVRIPPAVVIVIYLVGIFTMLINGIGAGYLKNRNLIAQLVLVLILALVFYLLVDLDRLAQGLVQVPNYDLTILQ
jgi:hypothetical protein